MREVAASGKSVRKLWIFLNNTFSLSRLLMPEIKEWKGKLYEE